MSQVTSTLNVDGVEMEQGGAEVVALYASLIRQAQVRLLEASQLIGWLPEEVEESWRAAQQKAERQLASLAGRADRFSRDYAERGLGSALEDAAFRKEL